MKRVWIVVYFLACTLWAMGQGTETPMADTMRSEGKIYVVVAIVLAVLCGLFVYLFFLQRKIGHLERRVHEMAGKRIDQSS